VIVGASIDLSVAYVIITASCLHASSRVRRKRTKAILVVFAIGALIGLVNGLIITKLPQRLYYDLGTSTVIKDHQPFLQLYWKRPKFSIFGYTIGPIPVAVIVL
jgi:ribose/xylose/arabinose/galactoside ABC-type transport system permease subunit